MVLATSSLCGSTFGRPRNMVIIATESGSSGDETARDKVFVMTPSPDRELGQGDDQLGQLTGELAALRLSYGIQQQVLIDQQIELCVKQQFLDQQQRPPTRKHPGKRERNRGRPKKLAEQIRDDNDDVTAPDDVKSSGVVKESVGIGTLQVLTENKRFSQIPEVVQHDVICRTRKGRAG